jgi:hypothetical protein
MSSKKKIIKWTLAQADHDDLKAPFRLYHYKGEHTFMKDHCYAAVHKGQQIAFVGTTGNMSGGRILWLVVTPEWDGYGIGLKIARLAATLILADGFNRVSFITEKKTLAPLLAASGWTYDRFASPSPHKGESAEKREARLKIKQHRFYTVAPMEPAHVGMSVDSVYGLIFGDSCVIESTSEKRGRGRPRKYPDDRTKWRLLQRARRERVADVVPTV